MIHLSPRRRVQAILVTVAVLPCIVLLAGHFCMDLEVYRQGGRAVLHGKPIYDVRVRGFGFTYPPFAALLFVLPALMPLGLATALMTAASLGSLAVVLRHSAAGLLARAYRAPTLPLVAGLAALVACGPVHDTLWNAQVDLLLAALVLSDVHGRRFGGIGVGVATAIKLTPAIFVVYLVACRRWREARNAIATFVAIGGWMWAALPKDSLRYWTRQLESGAGVGNLAHVANQSVFGAALREFGPGSAGVVWALVAVPGALIAVRFAARLAADGREPFALGIVGVAGCLVSPVAWTHHWVWCIPLLVGMTDSVRTRGRRARAWPTVVGVAFLGLDLIPPEFGWLPHQVSGNAFVVPVLLSGVAAMIVARRDAGRARHRANATDLVLPDADAPGERAPLTVGAACTRSG